MGRSADVAALADLGTGLGGRLRELALALRRHDAFVFRPSAGDPESPPADDESAAARDLVLRALGILADPDSYRMLRRLGVGNTTSAELSRLVGQSRLVGWERVNDLVQVGLVGRELDGDRVGLTAAGQAAVTLVEELAARAAAAAAPTPSPIPAPIPAPTPIPTAPTVVREVGS